MADLEDRLFSMIDSRFKDVREDIRNLDTKIENTQTNLENKIALAIKPVSDQVRINTADITKGKGIAAAISFVVGLVVSSAGWVVSLFIKDA